jgi:hypothetical protein
MLQRINLRPVTIQDALFPPSTDDSQSSDSEPIMAWRLVMVSDGSKLAKRMTFGWALCLHDGTRLTVFSGPNFGTGSSHHAEATGMLSGAHFLHHLQFFCGTSILRLINLISDNQEGLLTHITQQQHYIDNYATATLAADWDLIEQLNSSLSEYITPPKFTHVKGHQDKAKAYAKLPLDAQLNVDADLEAGNFQWNQAPTHRASVPMLPTACAHLHIADTTITGHYCYHIRNAASTSAFFDKCQEIHAWTPAVFAMINLPALRSAIRNTCHRSQFIFKFQHGLLPTQATKSVWDYCTRDCPSCLEPDTQHHFLRCLHTTVQTWHDSFLRALRARLTALHTSQELTTVLVDVIEAWLDGEKINPCNYPRHYRSAIRAQEHIGWHEFLQGY